GSAARGAGPAHWGGRSARRDSAALAVGFRMATVQTGSVLERSVLKEGEIFLVTDRAGDVKALNLEGHGLYYRDTRHLSLFELDLSGTRLVLLSAAGEL